LFGIHGQIDTTLAGSQGLSKIIDLVSGTTSIVVPFALQTPFSFDSDCSTTNSFCIAVSVSLESPVSFPAIFKMINVGICNLLKDTPISYHPDKL
jgi:hypothetical protein